MGSTTTEKAWLVAVKAVARITALIRGYFMIPYTFKAKERNEYLPVLAPLSTS